MILVNHPTVLKSHCSFVSDHNLWVVTPFMVGGSCLRILKATYPDGFEEDVIATVLREILKGLEYLHHHGHIHRDVKIFSLAHTVPSSLETSVFLLAFLIQDDTRGYGAITWL
ncbi:serine/threonine-protein kinase BLUS1-like [Malus domestica]|uniref:serine/threonine-protein kinase BLUS1-like n=1 Tax=Malus domestica TaxID=3750 RepID=UPI0039765324